MSELEIIIAKKRGKHVRCGGVAKAKSYFKKVGEVRSVECLLLWWDKLEKTPLDSGIRELLDLT